MRTIPVADDGLETGDMVVLGISEDTGFEPVRQFSQNINDGNYGRRYFAPVSI